VPPRGALILEGHDAFIGRLGLQWPRASYRHKGSKPCHEPLARFCSQRLNDPDTIGVLVTKWLEFANPQDAEAPKITRGQKLVASLPCFRRSALLNIIGSAGERSDNSRT
jgi:hypothetical protein